MTDRLKPTLLVNPEPPTGSDTLVIMGAARGGTSMVAGLLRLLGADLGTRIDPANNEDLDFLGHRGDTEVFTEVHKSLERASYLGAVRKLISTRNQQTARWGWKDPAAAYYIADIARDLRDPRLILVTRDPAAVAGRREADHPNTDDADSGTSGAHRLDHLDAVLDEYQTGLARARKLGAPLLIVSYERSLRDPGALIDALCAFAGLPAPGSAADRQTLIDYVTPERNTGEITPLHRAVSFEAPWRPEAEERIAADSGDHAAEREGLRAAGLALAGEPPHETPLLAEAMNTAMLEGRADDARALASLALDRLALEGNALELHPRLLCLELISPDLAAPPLHASAPLFMLGLTDLMAGEHQLGYWRLRAVLALTQRHGRWAAPAWATLYNFALASRLAGLEAPAREACQRILGAPAPGHLEDAGAFRAEPEDHARYAALSRTQLAEMDR